MLEVCTSLPIHIVSDTNDTRDQRKREESVDYFANSE